MPKGQGREEEWRTGGAEAEREECAETKQSSHEILPGPRTPYIGGKQRTPHTGEVACTLYYMRPNLLPNGRQKGRDIMASPSAGIDPPCPPCAGVAVRMSPSASV